MSEYGFPSPMAGGMTIIVGMTNLICHCRGSGNPLAYICILGKREEWRRCGKSVAGAGAGQYGGVSTRLLFYACNMLQINEIWFYGLSSVF